MCGNRVSYAAGGWDGANRTAVHEAYSSAPAGKADQTIAKATPVIAWSPPASIIYGEAFGSAHLNATVAGVDGAALPGVFSYAPPAGMVLNPGKRVLAASFTPDDGANYADAGKSVIIAVLYNTVAGHAFLPPINVPPRSQSVFKAGSTIPVKFQLFMADGVTPVGSAIATIRVTRFADGAADRVPVAALSNVPNAETIFRYDYDARQYIFNLSTRNWSAGVYLITAVLDDGSQIAALVGTR